MNEIIATPATPVSTNGHAKKFDPYAHVAATIVPRPAVSPVEEPTETPVEEPEAVNPLDVKVTEGLQLGWVTDYCDVATELTTSPRQFHELCALTTAAAAIQRKGYIQLGATRVNPNLYACIVAESTAWGKTQAIRFPQLLLKDAMLENLLIPSHGSSEGLLKVLADQPNALMIRDEIGTLLGSDKVKHLRDLKQDLTRIYDGYAADKRLANEKIDVPHPYLNIIGATTPTRFYSNVNHDDWEDGLLPRWLFATVQEECKPDFRRFVGDFTPAHGDEIRRLAMKLAEIESKKETAFVLAGDSWALWHEWRAVALESAYAASDANALAISGRYATYALKLAMILAVVNDSWGVVSPKTMQTSIQLADNYKAVVYKIIGQADRHRVTGDKLQRVFRVIHERMKEGAVTIGVVQRFTHMSQNQLQPCIDELLNIGAISKDEAGRTARFVTNVDKLPLRR